MVTLLSGTYHGPQNSDKDGCVPSLGSAIHSSASQNLPPQTLHPNHVLPVLRTLFLWDSGLQD